MAAQGLTHGAASAERREWLGLAVAARVLGGEGAGENRLWFKGGRGDPGERDSTRVRRDSQRRARAGIAWGRRKERKKRGADRWVRVVSERERGGRCSARDRRSWVGVGLLGRGGKEEDRRRWAGPALAELVGLGCLVSLFYFYFRTQFKLFEFKSNLNSTPMHSTK